MRRASTSCRATLDRIDWSAELIRGDLEQARVAADDAGYRRICVGPAVSLTSVRRLGSASGGNTLLLPRSECLKRRVPVGRMMGRNVTSLGASSRPEALRASGWLGACSKGGFVGTTLAQHGFRT